MSEVREGLDLTKIGEITPEEINANLMSVWGWRGPLYEMYANSLMLDYAPDFAKLHRWGSDLFGRPDVPNIIMLSLQNIHSYMMLGWETGILNEFHTLRRNGMTKAQLMEAGDVLAAHCRHARPRPRLSRRRRPAAGLGRARERGAVPRGLGAGPGRLQGRPRPHDAQDDAAPTSRT